MPQTLGRVIIQDLEKFVNAMHADYPDRKQGRNMRSGGTKSQYKVIGQGLTCTRDKNVFCVKLIFFRHSISYDAFCIQRSENHQIKVV